MISPENSIAKQFDETILSKSQISMLVDWLKKAPKVTTVRVNLLQTSTDEVKKHILKTLKECDYLPSMPAVEEFKPISEMLIIRSIDEHLITTEPRPELKEVIVDVFCAAAILRGAHIYYPGVLAMQSNTKLNEMVNIFADVEGACKKGTNIVYESPQKTFIGIGRVKMQRHQLYGNEVHSKGVAIEVHQTISCVPSIGNDYLSDQFSLLQNFPSIVCGRVLDPKPNEIILDMCASPGNKTTHIAQLMQDTGQLIALDRSENRVKILKANIERFKFKSVSCYAFDATKSLSNTPSNDGSPPFAEESFDRILLDAPCSGSGNRPVLALKIDPKMCRTFPKLQKKLLDTAVRLLKVDGTLVYSTCSVLEAENELNVAYVLQKYANEVELLTATPLYGYPGLSKAGLNDSERQHVQRFGPNLENVTKTNVPFDSTGFFIAKFRKKSSIHK